MKLYYLPGACSIGIHVILEEIGKPFELGRLDGQARDQYKPEFVEKNPKSKVPTLELDDGGIVTEFPAVAYYLGRSFPEAKLLPSDIMAETRALELMDYIVATVNMRGFTSIFRPEGFAARPEESEHVKAAGREVVEKGFKILEAELDGKAYLLGDYSIADAALFYVEFWGAVRAGLTLPPNLAAHLDRMKARPAVQRMLAAEGLT